MMLSPVLEQVLHQDRHGGVESEAGDSWKTYPVALPVLEGMCGLEARIGKGEGMLAYGCQIEKPHNLQRPLKDAVDHPGGCPNRL